MKITHDTFEHRASRCTVLAVLATAALACLMVTAISVRTMTHTDAAPARSEAVSAASAGEVTCEATKDDPGC